MRELKNVEETIVGLKDSERNCIISKLRHNFCKKNSTSDETSSIPQLLPLRLILPLLPLRELVVLLVAVKV